MNAWKIGMLCWFALGALLVVGNIGKPRTPTSPKTAVIVIIINALLALAVVMA